MRFVPLAAPRWESTRNLVDLPRLVALACNALFLGACGGASENALPGSVVVEVPVYVGGADGDDDDTETQEPADETTVATVIPTALEDMISNSRETAGADCPEGASGGTAGRTKEAEANCGPFGVDNGNDNSGVLRYVSVRFARSNVDPETNSTASPSRASATARPSSRCRSTTSWAASGSSAARSVPSTSS